MRRLSQCLRVSPRLLRFHNDSKLSSLRVCRLPVKSFDCASFMRNRCLSSKATTVSVHSKWETLTESLLDNTLRLKAHNENEAQEALKYWMSEQKDVRQCWKLLDRLALERSTSDNNKSSKKVPIHVIQPIVHLWQERLKETTERRTSKKISEALTDADLLLPSQVLSKLEYYAELRLIDSVNPRLSAMILDAASHLSNFNKEEGVFFADRFYNAWIHRWQQSEKKLTAPDIVVVGSVLNAWVSSGLPNAPERAEAFFQRALELQPDLVPNEYLYTSLISAWARGGNSAKAMHWLEQMQAQGSLIPDLPTWNSLLSALAKESRDNPKAATQAEALLQRMQELHESDRLDALPDVVSHSIVLDSWAKQALKDPKAATKAQQLFDRMKASVHPEVHPNRISYNTAIHAHARAGDIEKAEELLIEMIHLSSQSEEPGWHSNEEGDVAVSGKAADLKPDVTTFSTILSGLARQGTLEAAERAERIIKDVMPSLSVKPNNSIYSSWISCWAKVKVGKKDRRSKVNPTVKAQAAFDDLMERKDFRPDVFHYTSLMNAYSRNGKPDQAEAVMDALLQAYHKEKNPRLKPSQHTFSVLLSAWAHSKYADGALRAEEWLHRMQEDFGVSPNVVAYTTVIDAWSRRAQDDSSAPNRARQLLDNMRSMKRREVRPNVVTFSAVVRGYAEQGRAQEAESLLFEMLKDNELPNPDLHTFSSAIFAWSRNREYSSGISSPDAANRAELLLLHLNELYEAGVVAKPPNVFCYSNVLKCWARVPDEGAERATAILRSMNEQGVRANLISFNIVLNAWANRARYDSSAVERARKLLDQLLEISHRDPQMELPDSYTFRAMQKAIANSDVTNKEDQLKQLAQDMAKCGIKSSTSRTSKA